MELPPPWILCESQKYPGRCYYLNTETHQSSWIRPIPYPGHPMDTWPAAIYVLHILIKYVGVEDERTWKSTPVSLNREEAKLKITDLHREIVEKGKPFEDVAREQSDDINTYEHGGQIGWIMKGQMHSEEFDQMAWELNIGEMSPPIRTSFGWHLILRRG